MKKKGFQRIIPALINSFNGLKYAVNEPAFFFELCIVIPLIPVAFTIGTDWLEISFLILTLMLVLIIEIINTAVESIIDRIGLEWHELSKVAKDLGSAAVFFSMVICVISWFLAIIKFLNGGG